MIVRSVLLIVIGILVACSSFPINYTLEAEFSDDWDKFENVAKRHGSMVSLPPFELSPQASLDAVDAAIEVANAKLNAIAKLKPSEMTFVNTIGALDDISFEV